MKKLIVEEVNLFRSEVRAKARSNQSRQCVSQFRFILVFWLIAICLLSSGHYSGQTLQQLRDQLMQWLSPSLPSTNNNIARKPHHNSTAQWFIQGSIFNEWKSTGSLLWIRGKRVLLLTFIMCMRQPLTIPCFYSRFWEKCPLVCPSTHSSPAKLTLSIQFLGHRQYHSPTRCWECLDGSLLF